MARLLPESTTSFARGGNDSAAATAFQLDEVVRIQNARVRPDATVKTRGGSRKTHGTALNGGAQFYGGTYFLPSSGVGQIVVFVGDAAYYSTDEGGTWTSIASGLRQDYWSLVTMTVGGVNYLYCANGSATLYRWSGSAWATETGPTTGIKHLAVHVSRLYGDNGINVYGSKVDDPSVWTSPDGLTLPVTTHDGDTIRGLFSLGEMLLVFKRRSVGYVTGYGNSDVIVAAGTRGLSRSVGCVGFRTIVPAGPQGVSWLSERGVEYYTPGGEITLLSERARTFFGGVAWSNFVDEPGEPCALYYPPEQEVWCALSAAGGLNNHTYAASVLQPYPGMFFRHASESTGTLYLDADGDLTFSEDADRQLARIVDEDLTLATGTQPGLYVELDADGDLQTVTTAYDPAVLFMGDTTDGAVPFAGGYDGFLRRLEVGTADNAGTDGTGGVDVTGLIEGRPFLFRAPFEKKKARVAEVLVIPEVGTTVTLSVIGDGVEGTQHTVTVPAAVNGQPVRAYARVSVKGYALQNRLSWTGALSVASQSVSAEPLVTRP